MSQAPNNSGAVDREVEKLWSADEAEREDGKLALIRLGSISVNALLALLEDLMENSNLRFPTGKELEGKRALDQAWQARREWEEKLKDRAGSPDFLRDVAASLSVFKGVTDLVINHRLLFDAIELLGKLQAEAALPLLIEIIERESAGVSLSSAPYMRAEMIALVRIGPAAVLPLIALIHNANRRAENAERYPTSLSLSQQIDPSELDESDYEYAFEEDDDPADDQEAPDGPLTVMAMRIVARAAMVLGAIGDARALPVLREILSEKDCGTAKHYIVQAIGEIEGTPPEDPPGPGSRTNIAIAPRPAIDWRPDKKKA